MDSNQTIQELTQENQSLHQAQSNSDELNQELTLQNSTLVSRNQELSQTLVEKDQEVNNRDQLINVLRIEITYSNSKIDELSQKEKELKAQINSIQICHNNITENQNFGNPNQILADDSSSNEDQEEISSSDCVQNLECGFENLEVKSSDDDTPEQMFEKGWQFYKDKHYQESVYWWRRAADAGHADAVVNLINMVMV
ncbi:hypothetical protein P9112_006239 [Eukaryota sp. TZLM1-RC]